MSWLRWLQHVHNDTLNIRNFICDDESRKVLTERAVFHFSAREAQQRANDGADEFSCHYVVFVRGAQRSPSIRCPSSWSAAHSMALPSCSLGNTRNFCRGLRRDHPPRQCRALGSDPQEQKRGCAVRIRPRARRGDAGCLCRRKNRRGLRAGAELGERADAQYHAL